MPKYFDKNDIVSKAYKLYQSGKVFVDYMESETMFPFVINLKRVKQSDIQSDYSTIFKESEELVKSNLDLTCKAFEFKNIGVQTLPISVHFTCREIFLSLIDKNEEFKLFVEVYEKLTCKYPQIKKILIKKPNLIIQNSTIWDELMAISDFFVNNTKPNIYIRELSIEGIDTKFIENNKKVIDILLSQILSDFDKDITSLKEFGFEKKYYLKYPLPMLRFRILDKNLLLSGLDDLSISIEAFKKLNLTCKRVFIVENKITTLSFPKMKDAIVIFGSGYGVHLLKEVQWLHNKELYYWGDIDVDGFAILSQIRGYFPKIVSLFMNEEVVNRFGTLSVIIQERTFLKKLENLDIDEQKLYQEIQEKKFRLEQERISFDYIKETLEMDLK